MKKMTDFSNMTKEQRRAYLKNMPDSDIDYSDIPPVDMTDLTEFLAVRREIIDGKARIISSKPLYNHLSTAKKKSVSIRLDEDIIEWLKTQSNQYQTHINAVLRAYYEANKSNEQSLVIKKYLKNIVSTKNRSTVTHKQAKYTKTKGIME
jgi:uncharacterized protein (DUF4415 family)